jgi:glycosyltransferase involved in cell wall biosynthesis
LSNPFLSIVIPAHNEEKRLPQTLGRIFDFLENQPYSSEVIVVENASSDRTLALAREIAAGNPRLAVLHEELRGKGNAVKRGVLSAAGEFRFICDADLSMPIEELTKFLPPAQTDFDIALGSREAKGAVRYGEPAYRHWGGRAINLLIQLSILPGLKDTQCGFKCFRAETTLPLFRRQTQGGWSFDIELLYLARRLRLRVKEIPIHWYFGPDSKVSAVRDALRMLADILRIHANSLRGRYDLETGPAD